MRATYLRVGAAATVLALVPLTVSAATPVERRAPATMTLTKYYRTGPVSSCDASGFDIICSTMLVEPLRFTVPAGVASRAVVTIALQYRTAGQARFSFNAHGLSKGDLVPTRRPLAPSRAATSTTVGFLLRGLEPGSQQEVSMETSTVITDATEAASIRTSRVLVTVEFSD
ncbi:MAG TPA: hypothetical protein VLI04_07605 [Nocardioidaceae bacterium]|nr:hypothetical protein [Nocardioidaceae bacterium]